MFTTFIDYRSTASYASATLAKELKLYATQRKVTLVCANKTLQITQDVIVRLQLQTLDN